MAFPGRGGAEQVFIAGAAGPMETLIDAPDAAPGGIALIAHPHPLHGGSLDNKVVQTLARVLAELGHVALRPNFRGVGRSAGVHDQGRGETDDMLAVADYARQRYGALPVVLAGFSFGGFVQLRVAKRLADAGTPARRLVLVAPAVRRMAAEVGLETAAVPADTILIHGDRDDTVQLADVLAWAGSRDLPVTVVPGSDHFFHRKLGLIKSIIKGQWH